MRTAVVYGSLIVVLVLLPVFLLPGLSGAFFQPLALSYVLAIAGLAAGGADAHARAVAAAAAQSGRESIPRRAGGGLAQAPLRPRCCPACWPDPSRVAWALAGVRGASRCSRVPFLGEEFLPNFKEYDFLMHWVEKPGTSLEAMSRITVRASKELRAIPGVRNFGAHIGRAEVADEVVGPNFTELWICVDPAVDYDATVAKIQAVVDGYPGLYRDLLTYLRERIKEVLTGASGHHRGAHLRPRPRPALHQGQGSGRPSSKAWRAWST